MTLKKISTIILVIAWVGMYVATHIPMPTLPSYAPGDKHIHYVAYFFLTMIFIFTLKVHKVSTLKVVILALTIMPAYAAIDELTQPWVNRHCDFYDWFADVIGTITAVAASLIFMVFPKNESICSSKKE